MAPLVESLTAKPVMLAMLAAVLITLPVALVTLLIVRRQTNPQRVPIVWIVLSVIRMIVALAGSLLVYLAVPRIESAGLWYWFGIAVAYLSTLAAEVFVLAKPGWVGRGAGSRRG